MGLSQTKLAANLEIPFSVFIKLSGGAYFFRYSLATAKSIRNFAKFSAESLGYVQSKSTPA